MSVLAEFTVGNQGLQLFGTERVTGFYSRLAAHHVQEFVDEVPSFRRLAVTCGGRCC